MQDIESLIKDFIATEGTSYVGETFIAYGTLLQDAGITFNTLGERLKPLNLMPVLHKKDSQVELKIVPIPFTPPNKVWINLVLLGATVITTVFAGTFLSGIDLFTNPKILFMNPKLLIYGIPFSFSLLFILGSHELGHYFACRTNGILATFPYFIPSIPPLGTFGAVIRIKSPLQDKNRLVEVGAAGPICGFIAAIFICVIGLKLSRIVVLNQQLGELSMGNSIVFWGLSKLIAHPAQGYDVLLHPMAFAGWIGMFVTALNLIPLGQLDGGHIAYAFLEGKTKFLAWPIIIALASLGIFWPGWLFWTLLIIFVTKLKHPSPLNNVSPLDSRHKIMGIIALIIFVITFIPVPFKI